MMCKAAIDLLAKGWFQTKKMILWLFHMACLICLFAVVEIAQCLTFLRILTSSLLNFVFSLFPTFVNESLSISIYFLSHNTTWVFWRLTMYANFHLCYTIFPFYLFSLLLFNVTITKRAFRRITYFLQIWSQPFQVSGTPYQRNLYLHHLHISWMIFSFSGRTLYQSNMALSSSFFS